MAIVQYNFPTPIKYGPGAIGLLPEALKEAGVKQPLIVTDKALAKLPPIAKVEKILRDAGFHVATYSNIFGNPTVSQAKQGGAAFREHRADSIVAVGGGAALDVAKCIAVLAYQDGELLEYEAFLPNPKPITNVPVIFTVPTTAGTGSEVGRSAVVSDDVTHQKKFVFSPKLLARKVFLDPELSLGLPASVTAATGIDALTHCIESYLAKDFHPMCEGIALEGLRITAKFLPKAVDIAKKIEAGDKALTNSPEHVEARGMMLNAAMMGAVAFQKDLGVTHSCAHALSTVADLHHGLANGVMLPACMEFNKSVSAEKMVVMAEVVRAKDKTADGFIQWVREFNASVGIPKSLRELNVGKDKLDALVDVAMADSCHQFNPKPVTKADLKAIFERAMA